MTAWLGRSPSDVLNTASSRRYDLDWLRVLAFSLLIFYHTGMIYVEHWDFHFKSQYLSSSLEYLMLLSSPWRMLLIWFISGYALGVVLQQLVAWQFLHFAMRRTLLLLLPLLTGLWLIVPPQLFAQMWQDGAHQLSYWAFYQAFLDLQHPLFANYQSGVWPHVDVNHLWYLRSLWLFTLGILLFWPLLRWQKFQQGVAQVLQLALPWQIAIFSLMLLLIRVATDGDSDSRRDWSGLVFLVLGLLTVKQPSFWQQLEKARPWLGLVCLLNCGLLLGCYYLRQQAELGTTWQSHLQLLRWVSYSLQAVAMTCWLLALAQRFLNHPHRYLASANRAIFPIYLVHQSLIIMAAMMLTPYALGGAVEALLVILLTVGGCALLLFILWKMPLLAPLFGLKTKRVYARPWQHLGEVLGLLLVLPLAYALLF